MGVDDLAKVLHESSGWDSRDTPSWESLFGWAQDEYRRMANAALAHLGLT